ncbi:hypothetical protein GIB67_039918 [Kingdonia uniflora]|uniref:Tr-type G domain-containing protein n=1 Tax=Kingdonia uniflora TaxID=39325 RepID=A0A7J7P3D6_9MAGN|nr:hypothetical protein GIB67_039918 [Kingdonia uniflora]
MNTARSYGSAKEDSPLCDVPGCGAKKKLLRHVSFVVCPGHDILMATMLNGVAIMDGALLLIAANKICSQPQTLEHLAAIEIMCLKHIIILQKKVDLVQQDVSLNQHSIIQEHIRIPIPKKDFESPPNMIIIRSFDVNKPGSEHDAMKGSVAGGSILRGVLKMNQIIEIRPGIVVKHENGNIRCTPIYSKVVSLFAAEQNELQFAVPGDLLGLAPRWTLL